MSILPETLGLCKKILCLIHAAIQSTFDIAFHNRFTLPAHALTWKGQELMAAMMAALFGALAQELSE